MHDQPCFDDEGPNCSQRNRIAKATGQPELPKSSDDFDIVSACCRRKLRCFLTTPAEDRGEVKRRPLRFPDRLVVVEAGETTTPSALGRHVPSDQSLPIRPPAPVLAAA